MLRFFRFAFHRTEGVSLDAVASTHGRPGFQTPDDRVVSRNGLR